MIRPQSWKFGLTRTDEPLLSGDGSFTWIFEFGQ
jgi:hypothetical protein